MNSNSTFIVNVISLEIFVAHLYYITGNSIFLFAKAGSPISATCPYLHYLKKKKKKKLGLDTNPEFLILKPLLHQVLQWAPSSHSPPLHHLPSLVCLEGVKRCHSVSKVLWGLSRFQGSQAWRSSSSLALLFHCLSALGSISLLTLLFALTSLCKPSHCSLGPKDMLPSLVGALLFSSSSFTLTHQLLCPASPGQSAEQAWPLYWAVPVFPWEHQKQELCLVPKAWSRVQPAECRAAARSREWKGHAHNDRGLLLCLCNSDRGTALEVQWWRLPSNAGVVGSIPEQGAKTLHASRPKNKTSIVTSSVK